MHILLLSILFTIPQVSFTFSENKAVIASAVFIANLDLCSWTKFEDRHFIPEAVFRWNFVHFRWVLILAQYVMRTQRWGLMGTGGCQPHNYYK